jgi:hypothetical protein
MPTENPILKSHLNNFVCLWTKNLVSLVLRCTVSIISWSQGKALGALVAINVREQRTALLFQLIFICFAPLYYTFPECNLYSGYWSASHSATQACLKCIVVCKLECFWCLPVVSFPWFWVSCAGSLPCHWQQKHCPLPSSELHIRG